MFNREDPLMSLIDIALRLIGAVVAFTLHEWAHAIVAYRLGDDTQRSSGRLTLNPIAHMTWQGLLLVGVFGFGWARPVRVEPERLRHGRRDMVMVSLAGCAMNLLSCVAFLFLLRLTMVYWPEGRWLAEVLASIFSVSVSVGVFNLLPLPPLDGFGAIGALLRLERLPWYGRIRNFGTAASLVLIATGVLSEPLAWVMEGFTGATLTLLSAMGL